MQFLRRSKSILERQQAVDEKLDTIKKQIASTEKGIVTAKTTLGDRLGTLAMTENETNKASAKAARHALERQISELDDLRIMETVLAAEQASLLTESAKACVREAIPKAEEQVKKYNSLLSEAVRGLAAFRDFHQQLLKIQAAYKAVLDERTRSLKTLGVTEGLELSVGMGELALVPTPHRYVVEIPEGDLRRFLMELTAYEEKLLSYAAFTVANPNHGNIQDVGDKAGIGEMPPPYRHQEFKVFDPSAQR